jgi:hypothetical protein
MTGSFVHFDELPQLLDGLFWCVTIGFFENAAFNLSSQYGKRGPMRILKTLVAGSWLTSNVCLSGSAPSRAASTRIE